MKRLIIAILGIFIINTFLSAQVVNTTTNDGSKRKVFPHFSVSPIGGAIFPASKNMWSAFKPGGAVGLDLG